MEVLLAILIGVMFGASVYLMLSRNWVRYLFGFIVISNAVNLLLFAVGRVELGRPALVPPGLAAPDGPVANSLPQALILTAIVIGFGLLAFALVLASRAWAELGTVDVDAMRVAEPREDAAREGRDA
ncbi:MAG: cation:proton antiporter [Proteobacteria bacterium]|nr:MAG: cation:proton antiporter [Pseudomonadota bacterium]